MGSAHNILTSKFPRYMNAKIIDEFMILKGYDSPPKRFEENTGLKGISEQWKLPKGLSYEEAEKKILPYVFFLWAGASENKNLKDIKLGKMSPRTSEAARRHIYYCFGQLKRLNPKLKAANVLLHDSFAIADVLCGVVSQMNIDDIIYYSSTPKEQRNIAACNRTKNIMAIRANCPIAWVPSEKTLSKINNAMDNHPDYKNVMVVTNSRHASLLDEVNFGSEYACFSFFKKAFYGFRVDQPRILNKFMELKDAVLGRKKPAPAETEDEQNATKPFIIKTTTLKFLKRNL